MGLLGQRKRDWRIVYTPSMGKTRYYNTEEWEARRSEGMDKGTALSYLAIFNDAAYIEKIKGFRKGRRIYKTWKKRTMNKLKLYAIMGIALLLFAGTPRIDRLYEGRWQFWYDTVLWDFVADYTPDQIPDIDISTQGLALSLMIPDMYCYKHIGGYTGSIEIGYYWVPGDTNFLIRIYDGEWWGDGQPCNGSGWSWSTGKLER